MKMEEWKCLAAMRAVMGRVDGLLCGLIQFEMTRTNQIAVVKLVAPSFLPLSLC